MARASAGMGKLLGVGFLFGARDQGATRVAGAVADGLDRVADSARETGRASSSLARLGNAIGALNFLQLDRIGDRLEDIADRAGIHAQDTGLESFGVEFSNTFRRATVGLGPFRDEVESMRGEISGLAYSLDVDANEMISAVTAIARSGNSLEDFGLDLRTVAGSIQANILPGEQLGRMLSELSEGYELGTQGATGLIDRVTAIGEAFGEGAAAVRRLPEIISAADPILARFAGLSIEDVTESVTRLSVAMSRGLGVSFEEASQDAITLFTSLSEARGQITDLVTGVGSEFPNLMTELGIATGDIDEAMQTILSDPLTFADRMRTMMSTMDRTSPAFARLQSSLADMPANFRFLVLGGEEAGAALTAAQQPIGEFEGAFRRMARSGAGTARTFGESMERLEDGFRTRLNSMTSITTREVLGRQRDAFRRLGNTIEDFASGSHGGSLAFLTNAFLNVRRYGIVHGLLPMLTDGLGRAFPGLAAHIEEVTPLLSEMTEGLAEAAVSAGPMILAMSQLGVFRGFSSGINMVSGSLTSLLGPWGIAIAAIVAGVGLVAYNWDTLGPILSNLGPYIDDGADQLLAMSEGFANWVESVDWKDVGIQIGDFLNEAMDAGIAIFSGAGWETDLGQTFLSILRNTIGQADEIVGGLISGLFGDSIWGDIFQFLFDTSGIGAITRALDAGSFGEAILQVLYTGFTFALGPLGAIVGGLLREYIDFGEVGEAFSETFDDVAKIFTDIWEDVLSPIFEAIGMAFTSEDGIAGAGASAFTTVGEEARKVWTRYIRPVFMALRNVARDVIGDFRVDWIGTFRTVTRFIVGQIFNVIEMFGTMRVAFEHSRNIFQAGFRLIGASVRRFFLSPILQVRDSFMTITEGMQLAVDRLKLGFLTLGQVLLDTIVNAIPSAIRRMIPGLDASLGEAQDSMRRVVQTEESRIEAQERRFQLAAEMRQGQMAALNAEEAAREAEALAAVQSYGREYTRAAAGIRAQRQRAMDGIDAVGTGRSRGGGIDDRAVSPSEDEDDGAPVVAARTVEEATSSAGSSRERSRARHETAAAAADAADTRRARETAREMMISSFGREAITQLGRVFGGPHGTAPGRRGRGSSPGGSGEEAF